LEPRDGRCLERSAIEEFPDLPELACAILFSSGVGGVSVTLIGACAEPGGVLRRGTVEAALAD